MEKKIVKQKQKVELEIYKMQLKNMSLDQLTIEWNRVMLRINPNSYIKKQKVRSK